MNSEKKLQEYLSLVVDNKYNVGSVFGKFGNQLSRGDMLFVEYVLANNPQYINVVELGTAVGLTSLYFGMAMKLRYGTFYSFDVVDNRQSEVAAAWNYDMVQIIGDILNVEHKEVVYNISLDYTLAFIDNGDKAKEVNMYAPYLKEGSGFIVHDWGTEIFEQQIAETISKYNFKRKYEDIGDMLHCNCSYWVREKN